MGRLSHSRTLAAALTLVARLALADGAFPQARQVFLPTDHPHRIVLGSNQGLFISEDDGVTWRQVQERVVSDTQTIWGYQMGPDGTLYGFTVQGFAISTDEGCTWFPSGWDPRLYMDDLFPDPNDPTRVVAIGRTLDLSASRILRSHDRGLHFDEMLFEESAGGLVGVEVPLNAPSTLYITGTRNNPDGGLMTTYMARSVDDGKTFAFVFHPELGLKAAGIVQVDPTNANRVWLRVGYLGQDSLVLAVDGGTSFIPLLELPGDMDAFARGPDATLWVGDMVNHLWSSDDGGFDLLAGPQTLCLGARDTHLYSCGQLLTDGFDFARSDDRGHTFTGLLNISTGRGVVATDCSAADAGPADAGAIEPDAGVYDGGRALPRCGCAAGDGAGLAVAAALLLRVRRRRRAWTWLLLCACSSGPTREQLLDPQTCRGCHDVHFRDWSGSMHAYASTDPVFLAMNRRGQRETGGALGSFCVNCHAPMAVAEQATTDGLNLDQVPQRLQGVTCFFCHSVDAVQGTHDNPLHLATDLVMRGPFGDPAPAPHQSISSPLHNRDDVASATLCGSCHDVVTGHGAQLERTFSEWQASVFAQSPGGETCGECHMAQSTSPQPVANTPGLSARRLHSHTFAAVDVALTDFPQTDTQRTEVQSLLDSTLQTGLCVTLGLPRVQVLLDNVAAGHDFPSGASQDRRLWADVSAYVDGGVIYHSGDADPDLWQMRECIFNDAGTEVHNFWEAASYESNALPGQATFDRSDPRFYTSHVLRKFPRTSALPGMPDRVVLQMRLQPMGPEVIDDLIATGDLDAGVRGALAAFNVGPALEWTLDAGRVVGMDNGFPVSCVSATGLTIASTTVPAPERSHCAP
jgi:hypothetical protein